MPAHTPCRGAAVCVGLGGLCVQPVKRPSGHFQIGFSIPTPGPWVAIMAITGSDSRLALSEGSEGPAAMQADIK